jgi:hypothetical protein
MKSDWYSKCRGTSEYDDMLLHEAAHAVTARYIGVDVTAISVVGTRENWTAGYTHLGPTNDLSMAKIGLAPMLFGLRPTLPPNFPNDITSADGGAISDNLLWRAEEWLENRRAVLEPRAKGLFWMLRVRMPNGAAKITNLFTVTPPDGEKGKSVSTTEN